MATYRGGEAPDYADYEGFQEHLGKQGTPGLENIEEELNLWPEAGTDRTRRPGEKGYMKEQHIADAPMPQMEKGGAVHRREPPPRQAFDPKGPGYDDETADWEGMQAEISPEDGKPHGFSRVPRTGLLLKGREHPTFDKAVEEDRRLGYGLEMRDGRYYTQPFAKHEQGGMVEQPSCKHGSSTIVTCRSK